jgi:hypothetical protein
LLRSFRSVDSYGLVFVMIVLTYVLAVSLPMSWGATILLFVQIATVRLALHTSLARRPLRIVANVLFVLAALGAIANLFTVADEALLAFVFLAGSVLYAVAPFSIVRHVVPAGRRPRDDAGRCRRTAVRHGVRIHLPLPRRGQGGPFFGAQGEATSPVTCSSASSR